VPVQGGRPGLGAVPVPGAIGVVLPSGPQRRATSCPDIAAIVSRPGPGDAPVGEALGDHREELARLLELARLDKLDRTALNNALHTLSVSP